MGGMAVVMALAAGATASAQTTLYRNALAPSQNLWDATAGWSVSGTASKAALYGPMGPASVHWSLRSFCTCPTPAHTHYTKPKVI